MLNYDKMEKIGEGKLFPAHFSSQIVDFQEPTEPFSKPETKIQEKSLRWKE